MPFQLSPGVAVVEKDFSAIVPAVATSAGAFAGVFAWGPVLDPVTITSENVLVQRFGKPTDSNFDSFFTAANFLAYTNNLLTVRVDTSGQRNAVATSTAVKIKNFDDYSTNYAGGQGTVGEWAAKYPGALGNSLKVSMAGGTNFTGWTYEDEFDSAPSTSAFAASVGSTNDEIHVIVIDEDGLWTGTQGAILEKFSYVSKASNAVKSDGTNNYYKNVINSQSKYIWWMDHTTAVSTAVAGSGTSGVAWGIDALSNGFKDLTGAVNKSLAGGIDDLSATDGELQAGFALFANAEQYDISLIPVGKVSETVAEYVINSVAEVRLDCVAFISPQYIVGNTSGGTDGNVIQGGTLSDMVDALNEYRNELPSTSYAVLDSGSKYQYDRYNDKYRFVPLNGDIAGLSARTDYTNDPWFSPAGLNRGQVKNVVKLAVNPGKTERDNLYKNGVNPVVNFPGQGTVLFGDKTLLAKPSAFDRINVRRLFIVLEKAIATAAKYQLFEFNDSFTRAQFKNLVEPFLRDVQGRRGVTDFRVKCDDTNNTGEVIDRNEFIADIFIKPNRSINFITLNFIAARSSVSFTEIGA